MTSASESDGIKPDFVVSNSKAFWGMLILCGTGTVGTAVAFSVSLIHKWPHASQAYWGFQLAFVIVMEILLFATESFGRWRISTSGICFDNAWGKKMDLNWKDVNLVKWHRQETKLLGNGIKINLKWKTLNRSSPEARKLVREMLCSQFDLTDIPKPKSARKSAFLSLGLAFALWVATLVCDVLGLLARIPRWTRMTILGVLCQLVWMPIAYVIWRHRRENRKLYGWRSRIHS